MAVLEIAIVVAGVLAVVAGVITVVTGMMSVVTGLLDVVVSVEAFVKEVATAVTLTAVPVVSGDLLAVFQAVVDFIFNPLSTELNPIYYLLALLGAHHFLHVSRIRIKLLTFRLLMSYIYGAPILDVSRSHTTTQHSR
jgi:uncharacterized membrane protein